MRMTHLFFGILFLVLTACGKEDAASVAESAAEPVIMKVSAASGLNVRSKPEADAPVLVSIPFQAEVRVYAYEGSDFSIGGATGRWAKVQYGGKEGWAFSGFLEDAEQKAETAAAPFSDDAYLEYGFALMQQDALGFLRLDAPAALVLEKLGTPAEQSEAVYWGADGQYHQTWIYKEAGIQLDMVREEQGPQTVNMITVTAPCALQTTRGIGVGSSVGDVKAAYAKEIPPEYSSGDKIIAGTVYGGIIFTISGGAVSRIFIGAAAE
jgi:hypothetical protein